MMRRSRLLLIASLALNLFLLGAIAGGAYRWRHAAGLGLRAGWRARAADALTDGNADRFRATMRETAGGSRPFLGIAQRSRAHAAELFTAPAFNRPVIAAELRRARAADFIVRARVENRLLDFAATLPPDARVRLARALRRGPLRQPRPRAAG